MSRNHKNGQPKQEAKPDWILRAERSWRRIARKIRADSRRLGLKPVVSKWLLGNSFGKAVFNLNHAHTRSNSVALAGDEGMSGDDFSTAFYLRR